MTWAPGPARGHGDVLGDRVGSGSGSGSGTADKSIHLDRKNCRSYLEAMQEIAVIEDPAAAEVSLDPIRARLLAELSEQPGSASMLAAKVGLTRQKVNYHLKALEAHGLVEVVEERRKGNVNERIMRATAASFV